MRPQFKALSIPFAVITLAGCFNNSHSNNNDTATIGLSFAPSAGMSLYSGDAVKINQLGIGETLVNLGDDNHVSPALATSWSTDSPRSITFHLRKAIFQDGTLLTAQAAVNSLNHAWNATTRPRALGKAQLNFEAQDDHTLTVSSEQDDPILLQRFADTGTIILSPDAFGKNTGGKKEPQNDNPDLINHGTGPFALVRKATTSQADLKAHDQYWGGTPKLRSVTAKFITDAGARTAAFRSGEIQLATTIPTAQVSQIDNGNANLKSVPIHRAVLVHLNTKNGIFADPGLRAAARQAIDSTSITNSVFEGKADAATGHLFNTSDSWARTPDSASASSVHAIQPSNQKIKLATWTERGELPETATIVADELRHAGFTVDVTAKDFNSLEKELYAGQFDVVIGSRNYLADAADPVTYLQSDYTCEGTYNLSHICNPEIDAQVTQALTISNPSERRQRAAEIGALIVADNAVIPVAFSRGYTAVNGLKNIVIDPYERRILTGDTERD